MAVSITVTPMEAQWFGVQVSEGPMVTSHRIRVTDGFVDDLVLGDVPPEDIVREAVHYLLDRETATAIPDEISLDAVEADDHQFATELKDRLGV